jgi:hypothetical protein
MRWSLTALALLASGTLYASPGDLPLGRSDTGEAEAQPLVIGDASKASCTVKAGVCLSPAGHTVAVSSEPLVVTTGIKPAAPVVPRFSRAAPIASESPSTSSDEGAAWALDLAANLKRSAWSGNALFIFFDLEDPNAVENRQFTALYQGIIKAGPRVAAHLSLAPAEGFRAGHAYRLRIVQLIGGKEIVLGEGDFSLL